MKKKRGIILAITVCLLLLLGLGLYFRYPHNLDDDRLKSNPYFDGKAVCGAMTGWDCPDWFLKEKEINPKAGLWGILINLPEGGKEAGCVQKAMNIYCKDVLN